MEQEEYSLPPGTLFISFLLISGGYVLSVTILFILAFSLATVYSPETIEAVGSDPAVFEQQLQNNAADLLPQKLYWPLLILDALACAAIGFGVARLATQLGTLLLWVIEYILALKMHFKRWYRRERGFVARYVPKLRSAFLKMNVEGR